MCRSLTPMRCVEWASGAEPVGPPTADEIDPALRFECWTVADARRLCWPSPEEAGLEAGFSGAPPGPARPDAYRLGREMGAIAVYRVPVPAWMRAVKTQAEHGCIASA